MSGKSILSVLSFVTLASIINGCASTSDSTFSNDQQAETSDAIATANSSERASDRRDNNVLTRESALTVNLNNATHKPVPAGNTSVSRAIRLAVFSYQTKPIDLCGSSDQTTFTSLLGDLSKAGVGDNSVTQYVPLPETITTLAIAEPGSHCASPQQVISAPSEDSGLWTMVVGSALDGMSTPNLFVLSDQKAPNKGAAFRVVETYPLGGDVEAVVYNQWFGYPDKINRVERIQSNISDIDHIASGANAAFTFLGDGYVALRTMAELPAVELRITNLTGNRVTVAGIDQFVGQDGEGTFTLFIGDLDNPSAPMLFCHDSAQPTAAGLAPCKRMKVYGELVAQGAYDQHNIPMSPGAITVKNQVQTMHKVDVCIKPTTGDWFKNNEQKYFADVRYMNEIPMKPTGAGQYDLKFVRSGADCASHEDILASTQIDLDVDQVIEAKLTVQADGKSLGITLTPDTAHH